MGCVYRPTYRDRHGEKHQSAIWWAAFYSVGKQIMESTKTKDHAEALRYLRRREGEVANGVPIIKGQQSIKFKELADDVINDYKINGKRSLRTLKGQFENRIIPVFGKVKAANITTSDIRSYINKRLSDGATNATVNRELSYIRRAFNLGKQSGRIFSIPYFPMLKENNIRKGFIEPDQFEALCKHLPEHLIPVVKFALITGWRRSEILTLQWNQVDFENRCVRLFESKNDQGRVFPFTSELEALLLEQKQKMKREKIICEWVFNHTHRGKKGQPIRNFKRSWKNACKDAKIPGRLLLHDFRRTAVRNFERSGIPRSVAMRLTGHRTENTYRRYDIVSENDLQVAVERLELFNESQQLKKATKVADFASKKKKRSSAKQ